MDAVVAGGLFGVGGVLLGAGLNEWSARRGRREARKERRALELMARDISIAEQLDELLVRASRAIGSAPATDLERVYAKAYAEWRESWATYSPRFGELELRDRYKAVGGILEFFEAYSRRKLRVDGTQWIASQGIGNARLGFNYFIRGEPLPSPAFPDSCTLKQLLEVSRDSPDPLMRVTEWLRNHPLAEFRAPTESERLAKLEIGRETP